jgi:hypothetical protein
MQITWNCIWKTVIGGSSGSFVVFHRCSLAPKASSPDIHCTLREVPCHIRGWVSPGSPCSIFCGACDSESWIAAESLWDTFKIDIPSKSCPIKWITELIPNEMPVFPLTYLVVYPTVIKSLNLESRWGQGSIAKTCGSPEKIEWMWSGVSSLRIHSLWCSAESFVRASSSVSRLD